MKYPEVSGADPVDAYLGRTLKNWISSKNQPGENEKQRLLRNAALLSIESRNLLKHLLLIPVLFRWFVDNILIGSADQPMTYSLSTEYASSKSASLLVLMAKQDLLQSLSLQLGVA